MRKYLRHTCRLLPVLAVPLLMLLPNLGRFAYLSQALYSDITITHYPNALFLRNALSSLGQVPFWSDAILGGYPFAADPLSGLWYPPGWLSLILPLPLGFNLLVALHMLWGGIGMYFFLRLEGKNELASMAGALVFEAMPKLFAHYAAGHLTLIYAVPWTPWLLWSYRGMYTECSAPPSSKRKPFVTGVIWGLIILADVRWALFAGVAWFTYALHLGWSLKKWSISDLYNYLNWLKKGGFLSKTFKFFGNFLLQAIIGIFIATPLLLPLFEFLSLSTRRALSMSDNLTLSLPPSNLFGLLFPSPGGNAEWTTYPGALCLLMTIWVLGSATLCKKNLFWLFWILFTILFALGSNIPLMDKLVTLPGINLLRVPARALFLTGIGFSVLTATGVQSICDVVSERIKFRPDQVLWLTGFAVFVPLLSGGLWGLTGNLPIGMLWGTCAIVVQTIIILLWIRHILPIRAVSGLILLLALLDMEGSSLLGIKFRASAEVLGQGDAVARYLSEQEKPFRVYSPSYSVPQQTAAKYQLELADGIDPMQLSSYVQYMEKGSGVPVTGYSVTLPPFSTGNPQIDNQQFVPDLKLLSLLNVRFIASEFVLPIDGLILKDKFGETRLYENLSALPRVWIQPVGSAIGTDITPVQDVILTPNWISLAVRGPGLLVLSEVNYPGWHVLINDKEVQIKEVMGLLRAIPLPDGEWRVRLVYRPWLVYSGVTLSMITLIVIIIYRWLPVRKKDTRND